MTRIVSRKSVLCCLALTALLIALSIAYGMDLVRIETRADQAVAQFGVTGSSVLVGVLDRGIDYLNQDFRNDDGSTRIEYIFDLTDDSGADAPGNIYGKGTIYTRQQIDQALLTGIPLATRDAVGHGTATAGIIAGNGRNLPSRKYRGIASNATIIAVKVTSDGAPAHDGEPAEAAFFDPARLPLAIDFVRDKAAELARPCVMILNLGSQGGPTDGTSELCRKIDSTVGPGVPGLVFVTGPGDDGGVQNRAGGSVAPGQTVAIEIEKGHAGFMRFDLWYAGQDRLTVSVRTPSGIKGPYAPPLTNNQTTFVDQADFDLYHQGANRDFFNASNGKRELLIDFSGPPGRYAVELTGSVVHNGRFDATLNPSNILAAPGNYFVTFVAPGSLWDGATARHNICPGDYVIRTHWTDLDGIPRSITDQGSIGEIWRGSSTGPTFDGRLGVDVVAPGDSLFTTYNPRSYFATFRFNLIQDGAGLYGRASAVSAAAPIATGVIALMLELNPQLDAITVREILRRSARADQFTGQTPNPVYGYGKVDALRAVAVVSATVQQ